MGERVHTSDEKRKILVVEDEADIRQRVCCDLTRDGYAVSCAASGEEALKAIENDPVDLVILDLALPGIGGLEVARRIRQSAVARDTPIVILTAKGEETDAVAGLELGADDYVVKPFSPRVLAARVKVVIRKRSGGAVEKDDVLTIRKLRIHPGRHHVSANGRPLALTFTEFQVLYCLARRPGWVFTRSQIVDAVRGEDYPVTERSVDVQIVGLRKKLGSLGTYIETVRGVGYRFIEN
ncbi:MAG: DNA-binding response regulator [Proteobacteria bacterium]|nr:MAG: DNA-binding response regulator [Pseudomonadota bacterium]